MNKYSILLVEYGELVKKLSEFQTLAAKVTTVNLYCPHNIGRISRPGLFSADDLPAVDEYHFYGGVAHHGVAVGNHQVSVFTNLQGAHTVCDPQMFGGIDGDGLERGKGIHPGLDCQPGTEGEVLLGNDR